MSDSEKPKSSWRERRQSIKQKWKMPLGYVEWRCEQFSYFLGRWALLDICGHIGRFGVLVSIIVGVCVYVMEADERRIEAENQRKAKHYQAWQVINTAQGKPGSGGRIDALQDLNEDGVYLAGADISNAWLEGLNLENALLFTANFSGAMLLDAKLSGAILSFADFSRAELMRADLSGAHLSNANLSGANLSEANFFAADLITADLTDIKGWRKIKSIKFANIHGVKNAPDGFIEWAKQNGAVNIVIYPEWKKLRDEKMQEKTKEKQ